jgi:hypothetical protein
MRVHAAPSMAQRLVAPKDPRGRAPPDPKLGQSTAWNAISQLSSVTPEASADTI